MSLPLRVKQLTVRGFKGFREEVVFDLDADVVLLVGNNGRGKTSVVEAIEAVVCGPDRVHGGSGAEDLIHRAEDRPAFVRAVFGDGDTEVDHSVSVARGGTAAYSLIDTRTGELAWARWRGDRVRQLQALAFLYADNLRSATYGLDLGMLVPESEAVQQLVAHGQELQASLQGLLAESKAAESRRKAATAARLAALRLVEERAAALGLTVKLTTARAEAHPPDHAALVERLTPDATGPFDWATLATTAAARAQVDTGPSPSPQVLLDDVERIRSSTGASTVTASGDEEAAAELARLTTALREQEAALAERLRDRDRILARPTTGGEAVPTGEVPLLLSMLALGEDAVRKVLADVGLELRGEWQPARLEKRAAASLASRVDLEQKVLSASTELSTERAKRDELARAHAPEIRAAVDRLITQWPTAGRGELPMQEGRIDLIAAAARLAEPAVPTVRAESLRWADLAHALRAVAELPADPGSGLPRVGEIANRKDALEHLWKPQPDGRAALSHHLRHSLALVRFRDPTVLTMRRLLRFYRFSDGFADEVGIDDDLEVAVGAADRRSTFRSLSRSQQAAVATTQALALNLALPDPPIGFVCIDDLSDSFDLENLTAGSLLLRTVAYGPALQRRQLVLSSHDELVTERLIPLLLPPAGFRMKVVELIDGAPPRVVEIQRERRTTGGPSPLQAHYPLKVSPG